MFLDSHAAILSKNDDGMQGHRRYRKGEFTDIAAATTCI